MTVPSELKVTEPAAPDGVVVAVMVTSVPAAAEPPGVTDSAVVVAAAPAGLTV